MFYDFPLITHISEVEHIVQSRDEFIIAEREGYKVVNYIVCMEDTFPPVLDRDDALRRELRGIVFNENGDVISRRLHKFFNVNEREETQIHNIDISEPHMILEKLDGSMVTPIPIGDAFRWATKMGVTETSMLAEEFVVDHPEYDDLARFCHEEGVTPIFEYMSRKNRIVVDYPEERLVLLALRDTFSGDYISYKSMQQLGERYCIDVVKTYPGTIESMKHLIDETRGVEGIEGWILRFNNGHMVKVKSEWYVNLHRTKDAIRYERNLVTLILNDQLDDIKAFMLEEDLKRVEVYHHNFRSDVAAFIDRVLNSLAESNLLSRKDYALDSKNENPVIRSMVFKFWDDYRVEVEGQLRPKIRDEVLRVIEKHTTTNKKFEEMSDVLSNCKWGV